MGWGDWYDEDGGLPSIPTSENHEESVTKTTQANCFHRWEITGYGPNSKDPWENCKNCGMKKEDYEKEQKNRSKKFTYPQVKF